MSSRPFRDQKNILPPVDNDPHLPLLPIRLGAVTWYMCAKCRQVGGDSTQCAAATNSPPLPASIVLKDVDSCLAHGDKDDKFQ